MTVLKKCKSFHHETADFKRDCRNCTVPHSKNYNGSTSYKTIVQCITGSDSKPLYHLEGYPRDITTLFLVVDNKWLGYYPLLPSPINLTHLSRFENLTIFQLAPCYSFYMQPYPLHFTNNTFAKLRKMKEFIINLSIVDVSFGDVVKHFPQLELLDLSFTRQLSINSVRDTLSHVNAMALKALCLITFQLAGGDGYHSRLDLVSMFSNQTFYNLKYLALSENSIARLYSGFYEVAPNLTSLYISGNLLLDTHNIGTFLEAVMLPKLRVFDMAYQGFLGGGKFQYRHPKLWEAVPIEDDPDLDYDQPTVPDFKRSSSDDAFEHPEKKPKMKHNQNNINGMLVPNNHSRYSNMTSCANLIIQNCSQSNISYLFTAPDIEQKKMISKLAVCIIPYYFTNELSWELFPVSKDIVDFNCMFKMKFPVSPSLQKVYIQDCQFQTSFLLGLKTQGKLCVRGNNLSQVYFSRNAAWLEGTELDYVINNTVSEKYLNKLRLLDISNNDLGISASVLMNKNGLNDIRVLKFRGNNVYLPNNMDFCLNQRNLTSLDLSDNNLGKKGQLPTSFVHSCSKLQTLNLSMNALNDTNLLEVDLSHLHSIRTIDLSYNHISNMSQSIRDKLTDLGQSSRHMIGINLTNNPLICGCTDGEFVKWIISNNTGIFFYDLGQYTCFREGSTKINLSNLTVSKIDQYLWRCSGVYTIIISVSGTLMVITALVFILCIYRNRWKLRYQIFKIQRIFEVNKPEGDTKARWKYDLYVSYSDLDRFWVHSVLMETLEKKYLFNLYIRFRDAPIGPRIDENIKEQMSKSRDFIIVVSNTSLSRKWCQFELKWASTLADIRNRRLIIIKLDSLHDLRHSQLTAELLDENGYISWMDVDHPKRSQTMEKLFWSKLVYQLYGHSRSCVCRRCSKERIRKSRMDLEAEPPDERRQFDERTRLL